MVTQNNWIAVTPFAQVGIKTRMSPGLALMEHTVELQKLTVVFELQDDQFRTIFVPGDEVFLKSDAQKHQWMSEVYTAPDGTKYILIPRNLIVGVNYRK
jgi:hypothetical protein